MKTGTDLTRFAGLTAATLCVIIGLLCPLPAGASVYNVINTNSSGTGSLFQAMSQAQSDTNAVINVGPGLGTITLSGPLPAVQNNLVLNGNSNTISGASSNRIFFVNAPGKIVQINGLTLSNGFAQGGNGGPGYGGGGGGAGLGGAIFLNAGNLTVSNVSFLNNSARGGAGSAGFNGGLNSILGGGGGGGGLSSNGGGGGGSLVNKTYVGPAGGGGAMTSAGNTVIGGSAFGSTGGGMNGGVGGAAGLNASAGNGVSPSLPDGGGGGGGMSTGPGNGGSGGNGNDFSGGGGAGSSEKGNSGKSGNGGFGGGGGGNAFSVGGIAFQGGSGGFGGGGGGGGEGVITNATNILGIATNSLGGTNGFGGGFGASGATGNGGGGLGAGGAIFARAGSSLAIEDSTFNGDVVAGGSATSPATNGLAIGQALFLGANVNYSVSSGTNNLFETIGGGNDPNAEGGLAKSGAGTLALSGGLSYVGNTTVNAGTLVVSNMALLSPVVTINSNAVLAYNYSKRVLQSGTTYTGSGTLRFNGTGNPTFGTNVVNVNFSPGALIDIESGQLTGSTNHGGLWTANQASMNIASGSVFDAEEAGTTGTMQIDALTGQGTFQGGFVNNPNGLSTVTIGVAGGSGNFTGTLQDDSRAHLGVIKTGSGTNIFSGTTTYTGNTIVNGGTLVVSNIVLHSPVTTIAAGAVLEFSEANRVLIPGTTYTGAGTLRFIGTGNPTFGAGAISVGFSPGALIDIQSGQLTGSYNFSGFWTSNQASMNIATGAVFDAADAGPTGTMQMDALTGGGIFQGGNSGVITVTVGVAGGSGTFSGPIKDDLSASLGIVKTGSGTEIFSGTNTYSGNTIVNGGALVINGTAGSGIVLVNGGTLGGAGTISGAVSVGPGATLAPGAPTGTLTMLNTLSLAGNTLITLNSGAASKIAGLAGIDYSGTLTITNIGGPLSPGSSFTLFSARSSIGNFSSIIGNPGEGLAYRFNPANGVLTVVSTILPTTPTNLTFKANSGSLTLNWPASYTGWILQAQTNPLALGIISSNWQDVAGSGSTDSMSFTISPTNNVFFRMRLPQ